MKFIPILFSAPMVQALREDRKTQTRRLNGLDLVNSDPEWMFSGFGTNPNDEADKSLHAYFKIGADAWGFVKSPYGQPGDVLWVRENFRYEWAEELGGDHYFYKADFPDHLDPWLGRWKPSIHMPKEACRLFLKVKSVRVERLQDINANDAIAEGVISDFPKKAFPKGVNPEVIRKTYEIMSFRDIWQKINGAESWNANPWVWVVEFEKIEKPDDFLF